MKNSLFKIDTERLILRKFVLEDLNDLAKLTADKDYMAYSVRGTIDIEGTKIVLHKTIEDYKKLELGRLAVIDKETGKLIGNCGLHKINVKTKRVSYNEYDDEVEKIELSYRLDKDFWGKGLATEAATAVRDYIFSKLDIKEIISCIDEKNLPSICIAKKLGMSYWQDGKIFGYPCKIYRLQK